MMRRLYNYAWRLETMFRSDDVQTGKLDELATKCGLIVSRVCLYAVEIQQKPLQKFCI